MKKHTIYIIPIIFVAGCATLQSTDPNIIAGTQEVIEAVGAVGTAVGGPIGGLILIGTTALSTVFGAWQRNRKKATDTKYDALQKVTSIVVETIEDVSNIPVNDKSVGIIVKDIVKAKLEKSNTYESGKKIITAIKEGIDDGKND